MFCNKGRPEQRKVGHKNLCPQRKTESEPQQSACPPTPPYDYDPTSSPSFLGPATFGARQSS